jgi:hypothetical protein
LKGREDLKSILIRHVEWWNKGLLF